MKKPRFIKTLFITAICLLPISSVEASKQWRQAFVEGDHTFTITFSANIEAHKNLLQSVNLFVEGQTEPIEHTVKITDTVMTLDPKSNLQTSETYTVEVLLTNGETFERDFFIRTVPVPIRTFTEQYPEYEYATFITNLLDQSDEVSYLTAHGEQPSIATQNAVQNMSADVEAFKKSIKQIQDVYNTAATEAATAQANEVDVDIQLEALNDIIHTHITDATSLASLTKTKQARDNAVTLLRTVPKSTEAGIDLVDTLQELNETISEILLVAPTSQEQLYYVNNLQTTFTESVAKLATITEAEATKQIATIDALLENAIDYTNTLDDINALVTDINGYLQQFESWKDANISNVSTTYNKLQTSLQNLNKKLAATSSVASIEATYDAEVDDVDTIVTNLPTYIDAYLEKEIDALAASLTAIEDAADKKDIDYNAADHYSDASDAVIELESQYYYYDETIPYTAFRAAMDDATKKIAALKKELGV